MTSSTVARAKTTDHNGKHRPSPASDAADAGEQRPHGTGGPDTGPAKTRDALLDNAKFVLITLVFVGHAVAPIQNGRLGGSVYVWIYLFHMPAFVLIAGYLSKSFDGSPSRINKLLSTVAAPYLIFWTLYALHAWWADRKLPDGPLEPVWLTWFLLALFVWRLTAPLWRRVRWPIPTAIAISMAAGLSETGEILGISRILSLLPFFVAGLYLERRHLDYLRQTWVRICSVLVMIIAGAVAYLYIEPLSREWLYWRESLADRDFEILPYGLPARTVFMVLAMVLTAAVLSLIPRRRMFFTALGASTMYVFLLHGFVVRLGEQFGWYEFAAHQFGNRADWVITASLAVLGTFLLCAPWVRRATRWAVEPRLDWLLLRDRTKPGAAPDGGPVATSAARANGSVRQTAPTD